jgi:hypothetical protein
LILLEPRAARMARSNSRFRHGFMLLRMVYFAFPRIKAM